jgi:hypothetical protein
MMYTFTYVYIYQYKNVTRQTFAYKPILSGRGLLGRVASPNGGINSMVLASGCCPVRFDLDHSGFCGLEVKGSGQECPLHTNQSSGRSTNPRVTGLR